MSKTPPFHWSDGSGPGRTCLLVLNSESRSGAEARAPVLAALRERGLEPVGGEPLSPLALEDALRDPEIAGSAPVLIGGGDGTLNSALPALLRAGTAVGILPLGTANDFAVSLGIPASLPEALRVALGGRRVRVDVGRVNGRPYLNVAHLGLGAKVTQQLSSELKARLGHLGYPRTMLGAFREARPFRARIEPDGAPARRLRCIHLSVGNGRLYGGGAVISQDARLVDRRLHLLALAPTPLWRLILMAPWLRSGRHRKLSGATVLDASGFRIETSRPLAVAADGEIVAHTPATFDLLPGALTVLVPPDSPERAPALAGRR